MQREAEGSQSDLVDGVLEAYSERQVGKKAKREDYENDDVEWEEVPSAGLVVFSTTFCYYTYICVLKSTISITMHVLNVNLERKQNEKIMKIMMFNGPVYNNTFMCTVLCTAYIYYNLGMP